MSYVYRMSFPIEDDSMRLSQVINSALLIFPEVAEERGIKVTGDVKAWIDGDSVHCEAAAEVIEGRKVKAADLHGWRVAALYEAGWTDRQISDEIGVGLETTRTIRVDLGLPARGKRRSAA